MFVGIVILTYNKEDRVVGGWCCKWLHALNQSPCVGAYAFYLATFACLLESFCSRANWKLMLKCRAPSVESHERMDQVIKARPHMMDNFASNN